MEKQSRLILVQVDHASGEVLGFAVERIMQHGARNVQLIPTITKKNRPGHILLVDVEAAKEEVIAEFLVKELSVAGYHRIDTTHVFQRVTFAKKKLSIRVNGRVRTFQCEVKLIGDPAKPLSVDVEHDFLVKVQNLVREKLDCQIPLSELRTTIESKLLGPANDVMLEI